MSKKLRATPVMMILFKDVDMLEHDASTQYRFNRFWAIFWFLTIVAVPIVPSLRHPILSLLIMEASLWANFATHFGAMSAALAAKNTDKTIDTTSDVVDDVHATMEQVGQVLGVQ